MVERTTVNREVAGSIPAMSVASMSEWSKEPDLRSGSVSCVGSNPTQCTLGYVIVLPPRGVSWLILRELFFHSSVGQSIRLLIVGSEVRTLLEEKIVYIVFFVW